MIEFIQTYEVVIILGIFAVMLLAMYVVRDK